MPAVPDGTPLLVGDVPLTWPGNRSREMEGELRVKELIELPDMLVGVDIPMYARGTLENVM